MNARIVSVAFAIALIAGAAYAAPATTEATKAPATTHVMAKATQHAAAAKTAAAPRVDLNSASKEDLMKLPGVGDAIADKIIAARPFKTRAELRSKNLVNGAAYAKLRGLVTAKQASVAEGGK